MHRDYQAFGDGERLMKRIEARARARALQIVRADDAHRALFHQARIQPATSRSAAAATKHVQLAAPLAVLLKQLRVKMARW